jgi:ribosome-associated protein YbcJ (S4-like RNA binding protein)
VDVTAYITQIQLSILAQGVPPGQLAVICVQTPFRRRTLLAADNGVETQAELERDLLTFDDLAETQRGRKLLAPDVVEIIGKCCQNITLPPPPGSKTVSYSVDNQCEAGGQITVRGHCPGWLERAPAWRLAWPPDA